ncbi:hypothetical protein PthBH41_24510 [Parageobacillus thermoglucosidasius]|nr:hypothetical protein PthBH41_24510 [Parageobacillus thermoglucosidasius]
MALEAATDQDSEAVLDQDLDSGKSPFLCDWKDYTSRYLLNNKRMVKEDAQKRPIYFGLFCVA